MRSVYMSHYKSNLRDIEFNLFEVLGRQEVLGTGPFAEVDEDTARDMLAEVNRLALGPVAESFTDADRNPPVFDPGDGDRDAARVVQEVVPRPDGRRVVAAVACRRSSAAPWCPGRSQWAVAELHPRRQPGRSGCTRNGPTFATDPVEARHPRAEALRRAGRRARVGRDDGADRAGRGLRRGRRPDQGDRAARRHLAHRGRQAVHHRRRARHDGEHLPPGARPARGRRGAAPRACPCSWCRSTW